MSARKVRPSRGDKPPMDGSERDGVAALGLSRGELWRWKQLATLSDAEFEAALRAPEKPTTTKLVNLARRRATLPKVRCCPHCGGKLP